MRISGIAIVASILLISSPVQAEIFEEEFQPATTPSVAILTPAGGSIAAVAKPSAAFDELSHGSQQITLALHFAQDIDADPATVWSIDRIAAAKRSGLSWREIHADMQARGAMGDISLGKILSRGVAARTRVRIAAARLRDAAPPPTPKQGAFRTLSNKDRRIAEALFDSQIIGPAGAQAWSLDQIATARETGRSWRRIISRLNDQGLVRDTRLSDIMEEHASQSGVGGLGRAVVVTDAIGRPRTVLGRR